MSDVKMPFILPTPFIFSYCNIHISLVWSHSLLSIGRNPIALSYTTSWGLPSNPGFNFTASNNILCRLPFRDTPDTCLDSVPFLTPRGKFHSLFLLFFTLKQKQTAKLYCLLGLEYGPLVQLHLH